MFDVFAQNKQNHQFLVINTAYVKSKIYKYNT